MSAMKYKLISVNGIFIPLHHPHSYKKKGKNVREISTPLL